MTTQLEPAALQHSAVHCAALTVAQDLKIYSMLMLTKMLRSVLFDGCASTPGVSMKVQGQSHAVWSNNGAVSSPEDESESESLAAGCWVAIRRGRFLRCSRMPSVTGPSPMEVKKLMLKRMLRGVSCVH